WDADLNERLQAAGAVELFDGLTVRDPSMAGCAIAGLHLWNDNFQASHNLCQGIDTQMGSYWHSLNHRREGHQGDGLASNLSNAKYWVRRVGEHPAYDLVYRSALSVLDTTGAGFRWATEAADLLRARGRWDPNAMIDWVGQAEARTISAQSEEIIAEIQWREIDLLVDWCLQQATGE
ncbi:MAG: hypothetical protein ACO1SX_17870, partial [Actinomycetota bacterium]